MFSLNLTLLDSMKYFLFIRILPLFLIVGLIACGKPERPKFVSIKSLEVKDFTEKKVTLAGEAVLHNPNKFAVTLKEIDVSVTVNDNAVGKVNQIGDMQIPGNAEFDVPLVIDFTPNEVYDNLLTGIMSILSKGELEVHYVGVIRMKVAGVLFKVPVDHRDEVKI